MSKGHMEAIAALKARRLQQVTASVTKPVTKIAAPVTKLPTKPKAGPGRPKVYASDAERQSACRARKKASPERN